jgi:hypothetical protein
MVVGRIGFLRGFGPSQRLICSGYDLAEEYSDMMDKIIGIVTLYVIAFVIMFVVVFRDMFVWMWNNPEKIW